jgi:hypothetical protein
MERVVNENKKQIKFIMLYMSLKRKNAVIPEKVRKLIAGVKPSGVYSK